MDDGLVIARAGHLHFCQGLAGCGVERRQLRAARVRDPLAAAGAGIERFDVQFLEDVDDGGIGGSHAFILAAASHGQRCGTRARIHSRGLLLCSHCDIASARKSAIEPCSISSVPFM